MPYFALVEFSMQKTLIICIKKIYNANTHTIMKQFKAGAYINQGHYKSFQPELSAAY